MRPHSKELVEIARIASKKMRTNRKTNEAKHTKQKDSDSSR